VAIVRSVRRPRRAFLALASLTIVTDALSCDARDQSPGPPHWQDHVSTIVVNNCATCHHPPSSPGGGSASTYVDAIGCVSSIGASAIAAVNAPVLSVLASPDHAGILDASRGRRARVERPGARAKG
jgi:hypothetical protein